MRKIKAAVVGCGSISDIYMTNLTSGKFTAIDLVACSDLMVDRMNASAEKFGVRAMSLDEICADPEIEMVICLTTPAAHYPIIKQALLAGKHVFSEKMIAVDLWQGKELVELANAKVGEAYTSIALDSAKLNTYYAYSPITYTVAGLPEGLTFENGVITGTPSAAGEYTVTVTADAEGYLSASVEYPLVVE